MVDEYHFGTRTSRMLSIRIFARFCLPTGINAARLVYDDAIDLIIRVIPRTGCRFRVRLGRTHPPTASFAAYAHNLSRCEHLRNADPGNSKDRPFPHFGACYAPRPTSVMNHIGQSGAQTVTLALNKWVSPRREEARLSALLTRTGAHACAVRPHTDLQTMKRNAVRWCQILEGA